MFRFSIAALLLFVVFAALGCAALSYSTLFAAWAAGATTVFATIAATIAAFHARGRMRVFASGFAIASWCLAFGYDMFGYTIVHAHGELYESYQNAGLFYDLHFLLFGEWHYVKERGAYLAVDSNQVIPDPENFAMVGRSLGTLTIAFFGGLFACYLQSREPQRAASPPDPEAAERRTT